MTKEVWERRLTALKEMGCDAIRTSHNPHMPELYDLCDEMGFLMMDEAFDEWENPKTNGPQDIMYTRPSIRVTLRISRNGMKRIWRPWF